MGFANVQYGMNESRIVLKIGNWNSVAMFNGRPSDHIDICITANHIGS